MTAQTNAINWFEIPVSDLGRAKKFYETVFNIRMYEEELAGIRMAYFPGEPGSGKVSGALAMSDMHQPSTNGAVLYLNANPSMNPILERISEAGGKVLMPKTLVTPDIGYMAFFLDTEGNKLALHSAEVVLVPDTEPEQTTAAS